MARTNARVTTLKEAGSSLWTALTVLAEGTMDVAGASFDAAVVATVVSVEWAGEALTTTANWIDEVGTDAPAANTTTNNTP